MVPVDRTAGGIDKALDSIVTRSGEHIYETCDVALVRSKGISNRAGHGTQSRLVQHVIDALTRSLAHFRVTDVTFDLNELLPSVVTDQRTDFVEILQRTRRVIIQSDHALIHTEQSFNQI